MLDAAVTAQLTEHLARLPGPVELVAFLDDSPTAAELGALLEHVAACSPLISLRPAEAGLEPPGRWRPSFLVRRPNSDVAVAFAGLPLGHELASLVLAVLHVGGHPPRIDEVLRQRIAALAPRTLETVFSRSCHTCPDVVQALNVVSVLNPAVRHVAVDGASFAAELEPRDVLAVPAVFDVADTPRLWHAGRATLAELVDRLVNDEPDAPQHGDAGHLDTGVVGNSPAAPDPFDVLVVGAGPAGAAAAVYAARKGIRTGLVADRVGGQVLDTVGIENLISVPRTEGPQLAAALEAHVREYDVEIVERRQARALRLPDDEEDLIEVVLDAGPPLAARTVVVATGARWRTLGVPGEDEYRNRGVTFCPHCDGPLFAGKRVAVIGGGNSGVEAAIDLAGIAAHVTVLEFLDELRADAVLQQRLAALPNVAVRTASETRAVLGDGRRVTGLELADRATGVTEQLAVDGVFIQVGLVPNTDWLDDSIARTARGEVVVDDRARTSAPGVFAAGDCTTVPFKQIVISLGQGATAALAAFEHLIRHAPAAPTP